MKDVWITQLRDKQSAMDQFRQAAHQLGRWLALEIASLVESVPCLVSSPLAETAGSRVNQEVVLVPIVRAGLALLPAFMDVFPRARVAFLGLRRNEETAQAEEYYANIPKLRGNETVIVLDPMLATGGSAILTCERLVQAGVEPSRLMMASVIGAPEGMNALIQAIPQIQLVVAQMDSHLNEQKFIVPGLGDFGDRYFGTDE
ncbi:MAG: uracil phosphoribosyltransferase [Acidobacteria bacterium]|nr:uracil phosphoribosyltransferase [Acidobacteriota bacterium]